MGFKKENTIEAVLKIIAIHSPYRYEEVQEAYNKVKSIDLILNAMDYIKDNPENSLVQTVEILNNK